MIKHDIDFLIVGSGIAGLSFAIRVASKGSVAVVTKKKDSESNTNYAQGGIASVIQPKDSFSNHIDDTLTAGSGLGYPDVVEKIIRHGPRAIQDLLSIGVDFSRTGAGDSLESLDVGREGGHSRNRVVHAADYTGREVESKLITAVKTNQNIDLFEDHLAAELLVKRKDGRRACYGCQVFDAETEKIETFVAPVTLLATGGVGRVYLHTTNPSIATGDGVAMAYRAGASIANMEFMQFHPTSLYHHAGDSFLISEAVRGEGAKLRLKSGEAFMRRYHAMKDLAPRDTVARAIDRELKLSGEPCVYLDLTGIKADYIMRRFPNIYNRLLGLEIDITREWIPVVPAAHYMCGGIQTDVEGRTDIENLFAVGEAGCTGMHGANRLASNSLLEAVVVAEFASKAAIRAFESIRSFEPPDPNESHPVRHRHPGRDCDKVLISHSLAELRRLMWDYVGVVRSNKRLELAKRRVEILQEEIDELYHDFPPSFASIELRNLITVAHLIIESAVTRKESRGLHFNIDHPDKDDQNWLRDTIVKRDA
jgi:L-aspartate oxidase